MMTLIRIFSKVGVQVSLNTRYWKIAFIIRIAFHQVSTTGTDEVPISMTFQSKFNSTLMVNCSQRVRNCRVAHVNPEPDTI